MTRVTLLSIASALCVLAASCQNAASSVSLTLTAERSEGVAANGLTPIAVTAVIVPAHVTEVVTFAIRSGFGDLSASNVVVEGGKATVLLYPPRDTDLQGGAGITTVEASIPVAPGQPAITATTDVSFILPTSGVPSLFVLADPPFVALGSGETMKLKIEGRYLTSANVSVSTSSAAIALPAEVTLQGEGPSLFAEIDIPLPSEPADIDITVSGGDAAPETVTAHFTAEGAPAFDIGGTFVQVSFGLKRISNYGMLKNDPDCVAADAVSLVVVEHVGDQVTMRAESCQINMPTVEISVAGFDGAITPEATPGFIRATNLRAHDLSFTLDGSSFDVPTEQMLPHVVGADLENPATDELPTDVAAGMRADDDEDGNPGVTIPGPFWPIPDTYINSRTFTEEMTGVIVDSNTINGMLTTRSESRAYGDAADSPLIEDVPSPYHLRRVDGEYGAINIETLSGNPEEITCDDVVRYAEDLIDTLQRPELVCE